jgi:hypothetical protein
MAQTTASEARHGWKSLFIVGVSRPENDARPQLGYCERTSRQAMGETEFVWRGVYDIRQSKEKAS